MSHNEGGDTPSGPEGASVPPMEDATGLGPEVSPKPTMPERYRQSLVHVVPDAMGLEWQGLAGNWLNMNRDRLRTACISDDVVDRMKRHGWTISDVDACPGTAAFTAALRARVLAELADAFDVLELEPFMPDEMEVQATMYHHGGHYAWHRDRCPGRHDKRRVAWVYYLHAMPRMFTGGDLEFMDGKTVPCVSDTLVMFPADQLHRVQMVELYAAEAAHARWSFNGWLCIS